LQPPMAKESCMSESRASSKADSPETATDNGSGGVVLELRSESVSARWLAAETATLPELADAIRQEHRVSKECFYRSMEHALRCGDLLLEAHARVPYGEWQRWVVDNLPMSIRCEQNYRKLAEHQRESANVAHLGVAEALDVLARKRKDRPTRARMYLDWLDESPDQLRGQQQLVDQGEADGGDDEFTQRIRLSEEREIRHRPIARAEATLREARGMVERHGVRIPGEYLSSVLHHVRRIEEDAAYLRAEVEKAVASRSSS
jgi:hypothetical protein